MPVTIGWQQEGYASCYSEECRGDTTVSGQVYDSHMMTAAHPFLPFGTVLKVVNFSNGWECKATVNDRLLNEGGLMLRLSSSAAKKIGLIGPVAVRVKIEVTQLGQ